MPRSAWVLALLMGACASSSQAPRFAEAEVDRALDAWHADAASLATERWLAHFAPDARIWRTDARERWDVAQLETYARARYQGRPISLARVEARRVTVGPSGAVAWFEETAAGPSPGPRCASGVLVRAGDGWRIAHCDLTLEPEVAPGDAARRASTSAPRWVTSGRSR